MGEKKTSKDLIAILCGPMFDSVLTFIKNSNPGIELKGTSSEFAAFLAKEYELPVVPVANIVVPNPFGSLVPALPPALSSPISLVPTAPKPSGSKRGKVNLSSAKCIYVGKGDSSCTKKAFMEGCPYCSTCLVKGKALESIKKGQVRGYSMEKLKSDLATRSDYDGRSKIIEAIAKAEKDSKPSSSSSSSSSSIFLPPTPAASAVVTEKELKDESKSSQDPLSDGRVMIDKKFILGKKDQSKELDDAGNLKLDSILRIEGDMSSEVKPENFDADLAALAAKFTETNKDLLS